MSESDNKPNQETLKIDTVVERSESVSESANDVQQAIDLPRVRRSRVGRTVRRAPRSTTSVAPEPTLNESPANPTPTATSTPSVQVLMVAAENVFAQVISGEYDHIEPESPVDEDSKVLDDDDLTNASLQDEQDSDALSEPDITKRVLAPDADAPKLQKVLAQAGVGSRRDLEQMISEGRITVNGETAHIGQRIGQRDRIQVDGKPVHIRVHPGRCRVLAYHKPVGEVVTYSDPQQRPTVFRRLPFLAHGKWQSVGRLDLNTEGLLLFTNFGELANRLMHPRFGLEREYAVRVLGRLSEENRQQLLAGVDIEGQKAAFSQITDGGGEGANHWYRVVIHEGRNREVRKLFDVVGLTVSRLIRIRYGSVVLPRGLKRSGWVDLSPEDIEYLFSMTGLVYSTRSDRPPRGDRRTQGAAITTNRPPSKVKSRQRLPKEPREFIPNPLQQTYDQRAFKEDQRRPRYQVDDEGPIPNPLIQNFDKRAVQGAKRHNRHFNENGRIPDPLQQTYDKRAYSLKPDFFDDAHSDQDGFEGPIPNPLQQTYDQRLNSRGNNNPRFPRSGGQGQNGRHKKSHNPSAVSGSFAKSATRARGGLTPPDPMRTTVGYVGADAVLGNKAKPNRRPRRR